MKGVQVLCTMYNVCYLYLFILTSARMDRTLKVKFYEWIRECGWGQVLSLDRIVGWVGRGVGKFSQLSNKKKLIWFIFYVYALIYPLVNWAIFFVFASLLFQFLPKKGTKT